MAKRLFVTLITGADATLRGVRSVQASPTRKLTVPSRPTHTTTWGALPVLRVERIGVSGSVGSP